MIAIPFNYQPVSVSVRTSSYDIPSGNYAYVTAQVDDGGTFTIDGSTALRSEAETNSGIVEVSTASAGSTDQTILTVSSGYIFEGQAHASGIVDLDINGSTVKEMSDNEIVNFKAASGQQIQSDNAAASAFITITGYQYRAFEPETESSASFWVPTGTTISGSGNWRATVSLYNELT